MMQRFRPAAGVSVVEGMVAVLLFGVICVPLFRLWFGTGISEQRLIRDFLSVSNVAEKALNRIDHQVERGFFTPAGGTTLFPLEGYIMATSNQASSLEFLLESFLDGSGKKAVGLTHNLSATAVLQDFSLTADAVLGEQRANNPAMVTAMLDAVNRRGKLMMVKTAWEDPSGLAHRFDLTYLRPVKPEILGH